jgi:hypothetical protein
MLLLRPFTILTPILLQNSPPSFCSMFLSLLQECCFCSLYKDSVSLPCT